MTSLFLREGQPGHRFQLAKQQELPVPKFRKYGDTAATTPTPKAGRCMPKRLARRWGCMTSCCTHDSGNTLMRLSWFLAESYHSQALNNSGNVYQLSTA
jgi:hypothetical protein